MNAVPTAEEVSRRRRRGTELRRSHAVEGPRPRMAVLGSFNLDLLPPFLVEALDRFGLDFEVSMSEFGQIAAQALDPGSSLYAAAPDAVLLVPAVEDLLAPLFAPGRSAPSPSDADRLAEDRMAELREVLLAIREGLPGATCYVVVLGPADAPAGHVLAPGDPRRGQAVVARTMEEIRTLGELGGQVVVVDWDWLCREHGAAAFTDRRLWYLARMRLDPTGLAALAELVARHARALHRGTRKLVAVDLDDTLWGGVVGEDGLADLELGEEGVGLAFQDFQRALLRLRQTGVLLAMCTKNDPDDALEVFARHPGMVLGREDFVALRVNWRDKATNLREIAEELGLGLDSFVFLDDNPVERDWVRRALPEVLVPELPEDPVERPAFLATAPFFDQIAVTDADLHRVASYRSQGDRRRLRDRVRSFDEFLESLGQEVTIAPVDDATVGRAAQLCRRTNQFNLTARRHTVADLERMMAHPGHVLLTIALQDRFGDSGITGLAILDVDGDRAEIDTLLLSCRVLGRRVEEAVLAVLADHARDRGARTLVGRFVPTGRNGRAEGFYPDHDFDPTGEDGIFELALGAARPAVPPQIALTESLRA